MRQRNQFQVLLSNWGQVRDATNIAADAVGTADEKYDAVMDSIEAHINKVQNAWERFTQSLGTNKAMKSFYNLTTFLIDHLDKIVNTVGTLLITLNSYKLPGLLSSFKSGGMGGIIAGAKNRVFGIAGQAQDGTTTTGTGSAGMGSAMQANTVTINANQVIVNKTGGKAGSAGTGGTKGGKGQSNTSEIHSKENFKPTAQNNGKSNVADQTSKSKKHGWAHTGTGMRLATAGVAGVASGVMAGLSGTNSYFGGLMGSKDVKINDIQSDTQDNIVNGVATGAATGLLSAIPGVGPILGPILGPIIGDGIGGLFKWLRHKDEIDRKQRVKDAQDNLKALQNINSATKSVSNAVYDLSSVEKIEAARKAIDELIAKMADSDVITEGMIATITKTSGDWNKQLIALERALLSVGNEDEKNSILSTIQGMLADEERYLTYAAQEEERYGAYKAYKKVRDDKNSTERDIAKALDKYTRKINTLDRQLWTSELESAFYHAGLSKWSTGQVRGDNLENVVQLFANELELTGQAVRDFSGEITDAARLQIETFLRQNEKFSTYFGTSTKTLNQMINADKRRLKLERILGKSYEEIADAFKRQDIDRMNEYARMAGLSVEDLQREVLDLSHNDLSAFARALNTTEEKALTLAGVLGDTSLKDVLKSPAELREAMSDLTTMFSELSSKGKLTGESLEKLNNSYFGLYNKYDEAGNIVSTSKDNIMDNLIQMLFAPNSQARTLYKNATFENYKTNEAFFTAFKEREGIKDLLKSVGKEEAKTLSEVAPLLYNNETFIKQLETMLEDLSDIDLLYSQMAESLASWQKHENETVINNLKEQIDALKNINEERKQEIELIKAKEALENAKNEKKRVYRAGVGWTYEVDQNAIEEAQTKLEEAENAKTEQDLQYQIDLLEQQNSILDNITKNEELHALKETVDKYSAFMESHFGIIKPNVLKSVSELLEGKDRFLTEDQSGWLKTIANWAAAQGEQEETAKSNVVSAIKGMETTQSSLKDAVDKYYNKGEGFSNKDVIAGQENLLKDYNILLDSIKTLRETYGYTDTQIKDIISESDISDAIKSSILSLLFESGENNTVFDKQALSGKTKARSFQNADMSVRMTESDVTTSSKIQAIENDWANLKKQNKIHIYVEDSKTGQEKELELGDTYEDTMAKVEEGSRVRVFKGDVVKDKNGNITAYNGEGEHIVKSGSGYKVLNMDYSLDSKLGTTGYYLVKKATWDFIGSAKKGSGRVPKVELPGDIKSQMGSYADHVLLYRNGLIYYMDGLNRLTEAYSNYNTVEDFEKAVQQYKEGRKSWAYNPASEMEGKIINYSPYAKGSFSAFGGPSLINELGTEGIVTPQGTLTALPAHTGIVPVDLTRNLYQLGELAPTLIKRTFATDPLTMNRSFGSTEDNSMNVNQLYASFNVDNDFDFEKLLIQARQYMAMTKNKKF